MRYVRVSLTVSLSDNLDPLGAVLTYLSDGLEVSRTKPDCKYTFVDAGKCVSYPWT